MSDQKYSWGKASDLAKEMNEAVKRLKRYDPVKRIFVRSFDEWKEALVRQKEVDDPFELVATVEVLQTSIVPEGEAWAEYESGLLSRFSLEDG